jgi:hypothetical protein
MSIELLAVLAIIVGLRLFWSLYIAYTKQRLKRRIRKIRRK